MRDGVLVRRPGQSNAIDRALALSLNETTRCIAGTPHGIFTTNEKRPIGITAGALEPSSSRSLEAFAFQPLAKQLTMTADGFRLFPCLAFRRLLIGTAQLHFAEYALTLHLLFQRFQSLIDIIFADCNVNDGISPASKFDNAYRLVGAYIIAHSPCEVLSRAL